MIHVLEPRYKLPSRTHFSEKVIPSLWKKVEDRVRKRLQTADSIAITTDSWTSRATENYVAVTAHFINSNWQVENYTLETKLFSDSHTAQNLASGLHDTVTSWQLERNGKGPAISTDNASNIVRAVKDSGLSPHVGCFAHTLNLATQRGLKVSQVDRLLGRVRRVVTFFHKSTSATSILKVMQEKLDLPNHKLLMDVPTSQKHPTVSLIHPLKEMLLRQLEVLPSDNMLVSDIKSAISNDLKQRYTDENILGFLLQASALDPRFKSLPYLDDRSRCAVYDNIQSAAELLQSDSSCQNVTVKSEPDETPTSSQASEATTIDVPVLPSLSTLGEGEPPLKVKKEN
ncbi:E3 SUMO-protein ligase ZBED1-like [Ruditapes philippinarum]|uniref:E3 SUMO-protein ligase ZBED1-like n=1 Tax=Ruditapes philippinarum TaxID=129788 RepID=UPI00295AA9BD|nr:E3 SUMO-protein ligase ZBED1-like [Ruditapes philippinarum]